MLIRIHWRKEFHGQIRWEKALRGMVSKKNTFSEQFGQIGSFNPIFPVGRVLNLFHGNQAPDSLERGVGAFQSNSISTGTVLGGPVVNLVNTLLDHIIYVFCGYELGRYLWPSTLSQEALSSSDSASSCQSGIGRRCRSGGCFSGSEEEDAIALDLYTLALVIFKWQDLQKWRWGCFGCIRTPDTALGACNRASTYV